MSTISKHGLKPHPDLRLRILVVIAVALCAAAAYVPVINAGWVYDDVNLVQPSPALEDIDGLGRAISTDLYRQAAPRLEASPYWRPLAMASFWLDTRFGTAPGALHLGNILLHALSTALLAFLILRRHCKTAGLIAAALAATWWALHPENVETVAWISTRYDLLCGLMLLSLLLVPLRKGPLWAALSGLVFLAGLFSKEGFGAMAAVVLAMDFTDKRPVRDAAPRWVAIGIAIAIWLALRALIGILSFELPTFKDILNMLRIYPEAITIYSWRTFMALPLSISHSYAPGGLLGVAAGIVIFAGLTAAAILRRRLAVPITIFLAGFVPVAAAMAMFHEAPERYYYIPSIGLALLVAELIALAISAKYRLVRVVVPVVVAIVTLFGLIQLERRLPDWQTNDALWAAAVRDLPLDPQANLNQAIAAGRRGDWGAALKAIEIAANGDPKSGRIASTYAWVLIRTNDNAGAVREAERATNLSPYQPDSWYYLAFSRHNIGDHSGELAALEKLLQIAPEYPGALQMRSVAACEVTGRKDCIAGR